jgi:hypothetical protein
VAKTEYALTLTRSQLLLLRDLAVASTTEHFRKCVGDIASTELAEEEMESLTYLREQVTLQVEFHVSLYNLVMAVLREQSVSATLTVSAMILSWMREVARRPMFDPVVNPQYAVATKCAGKLEDYSEQLAELRRVLENDTVAVADAEDSDDAPQLTMKDPGGPQ